MRLTGAIPFGSVFSEAHDTTKKGRQNVQDADNNIGAKAPYFR